MVYSTRRFVLCLTLYYFFLLFSVLLALRLPRLGKRELAYLSAFRTFVQFALVWFCTFPLPLGVWERAAVCDCGTPWTFLLTFFGMKEIL